MTGCETDDAQQNGDATAPNTGNVMDRVLETFDGLADSAMAAIGTGVPKIGAAGAGLAAKAGKLAGDISNSISSDSQSLGETAGGIARSIGNSLSQGVDAAVTFARGLFVG